MAGLGKKKEQRRARKAAKKAAATEGSASSQPNVITLGANEWFNQLKEDILDVGPLGFAIDGLFRNTVRATAEVWAKKFGALPLMLGKNLLFVQLLVIDEDRLIQGKLYTIGRNVEPDAVDVVRRSRAIFKEAAPFLLKNTDHWLFSRSLAYIDYNGVIDEAIEFPSYDPLGDLPELPKDALSGKYDKVTLKIDGDQPKGIPSTRCAEVFLFIAGDFEVKDNGFRSREAVKELLQELYSDEGVLKLQGFSVVAASAPVMKEKLDELKGVHLTA